MRKELKALSVYFSRGEKGLWFASVLLILLSFLIFNRGNILTLLASLIDVTSLIFNAKGNSIGQLLIIVFSVLYGLISYSFAYYGDMATYLGMTAPMSVFALAYAANDVVLVVLWTLASMTDISYVSMVTCFGIFLVNDVYTFINWKRMYKRQMGGSCSDL